MCMGVSTCTWESLIYTQNRQATEYLVASQGTEKVVDVELLGEKWRVRGGNIYRMHLLAR